MKNLKTIKVGEPLFDLVKLCYRANEPLLLIGKHGCGKSQVLEQAAEDMDIGYICRDLSLMEPTDLVGMPKIEDGRTTFLPPDYLPTGGKGLIVFEELNRCPRYMRSPCLQLLTARTLNDYVLPKGWLPVAAVNPNEEGYETEELDKALSSRFVQVNVVADANHWLKWAKGAKIHKQVMAYVDSDPSIFNDTDPRSWTKVSALLKAGGYWKDKPSEKGDRWNDVTEAAIAGLVGSIRAIAFKGFCNGDKSFGLPTKVTDLLGNYRKYRHRIQRLVRDGRVDLMEMLVRLVLLTIRNTTQWDRIRGNHELRSNLDLLVVDLPPDLGDKLEREVLWKIRSSKPNIKKSKP